MTTVLHCQAYWPVVESVSLKPSEKAKHEYPAIISEIVLRAFCRSHQCQKREIWYTYALLASGRAGTMRRIKDREFESIWFPRFATDKIAEAETQDRPRLVSIHTGMIKAPSVEQTARYLSRKRRYAAKLEAVPVGKTAKEIYG